MQEPMGLREFGRWVNLSAEAIRKAIKAGRIPASMLGTTTLSTGRTRPTIADPEGAARAMKASTNPTAQRDNKKISRNRAAVARGEPKPEAAASSDDIETDDIETLIESGKVPAVAQSVQIREAYKARTAKMEYERERGLLVNADEVKTKIGGMITTARSRLLGVPSKAKGRIPHLTVDEIALLDELVREALEDVAVGS